VALFANEAAGVKVTVSVVALKETVAATSAFEASLNSTVAALIVAAFMSSLKTALTEVETGMPDAPPAGVTDVTVGGVVSAIVVNDHE
jgi:hypothetical protein